MSSSDAEKKKASGKPIQAITPGVRRATSSSSEKENSGKRIVVHQTSSRISQRVELKKASTTSVAGPTQPSRAPAPVRSGPSMGVIFGISFVVIGVIVTAVLLVLKNKASEAPVGAVPVVASTTPSPASNPPAEAPKGLPPLTRGLLGHWKLDGDLSDATGFHAVGRKETAPVFINGRHGQAIRLDGTGPVFIDEVSTALKNLADQATFSLWFRAQADTPQRPWAHIFGRGRDLYRITIRGEDASNFWVAYGTNKKEGTMTLGTKGDGYAFDTWHHIVVVREGTRMHLYVDGTHVISDADKKPAVDHAVDLPLTIGGNCAQLWKASHQNVVGDIDDLRIYDRALSIEEVQELYQQP